MGGLFYTCYCGCSGEISSIAGINSWLLQEVVGDNSNNRGGHNYHGDYVPLLNLQRPALRPFNRGTISPSGFIAAAG
jgi:hypothetical protein